MEKKAKRWIDIYTTFDESEAAIIQGFLENEGIACRIESARVAQIPVTVGEIGEIRILVHPEDFDKASRIMEAARAQGPEPGRPGPEEAGGEGRAA